MLRVVVFGILSVLLLTACGPSPEALRRQQMLEAQRAEAARLEAERKARERDQLISSRMKEAHQTWKASIYTGDDSLSALFRQSGFDYGKVYYFNIPVQAQEYNYAEGKQSFLVTDLRNLNDSQIYSALFPDVSAAYQPGQKARSVLELILKREEYTNNLEQQVERPRGQRWVAAVEDFKSVNTLHPLQIDWRWEPGLFEDISWMVNPERAYEFTRSRSMFLQVGLRFCPLDRCRTEYEYRQHPVDAIRAEVISMVLGNSQSGEILAEFVRDKP